MTTLPKVVIFLYPGAKAHPVRYPEDLPLLTGYFEGVPGLDRIDCSGAAHNHPFASDSRTGKVDMNTHLGKRGRNTQIKPGDPAFCYSRNPLQG
jgi:hypothetical protein